ncbi:two-component system activity regulator YycH [Gracilibacillus sp. S3-1-1]|uniref:Two-component system activity regulator YycH n=1 Tax=Gracilibacillus pellucidus TaxID=3095368 RepID=A0ACC6M3F4_9BACI|nr:two-component system activity regulator YycH [Gracilibacillus sp. S3-1-1]MDX8045413.1 two-component system activity regulator YycH [Gracilibacillus sp. S3-1-1]
MRINVEIVKTILLLFLVALSILLTLGIWTYQGDYESSSSELIAEDAQLNGTGQTKKELIQPSQVLVHHYGETTGFSDKQEEVEVFQDISDWSLYDFMTISTDNMEDADDMEHTIELIFPTSIPASMISELFTTDDIPSMTSKFDRVYIYIDNEMSNPKVVFKSNDRDGVNIQASVQNTTRVMDYFSRMQLVNEFIPYKKVEVAGDRTIYIPNEINIEGKKYRYEGIPDDSTNFKNIFFRNPTTVASSPTYDGGRVYSDGQREVTIKGYAMEYIDFSASEENSQESISLTEPLSDFLITNSIEYVNRHNGWLVDEDLRYRLYNVSEFSREAEYRMLYHNFPVFSREGLSTIMVTYQNQMEYQYNRPLMQLTFSYDRASDILMNGDELLEYIEQTDRFSLDKIVDIQLGYRIEEQAGGQAFDLIPTWCIETNNSWQYVTSEDYTATQGGESDAMGTN